MDRSLSSCQDCSKHQFSISGWLLVRTSEYPRNSSTSQSSLDDSIGSCCFGVNSISHRTGSSSKYNQSSMSTHVIEYSGTNVYSGTYTRGQQLTRYCLL